MSLTFCFPRSAGSKATCKIINLSEAETFLLLSKPLASLQVLFLLSAGGRAASGLRVTLAGLRLFSWTKTLEETETHWEVGLGRISTVEIRDLLLSRAQVCCADSLDSLGPSLGMPVNGAVSAARAFSAWHLGALALALPLPAGSGIFLYVPKMF